MSEAPTRQDLAWYNDVFANAEATKPNAVEEVPDGTYQTVVSRVELGKTGPKSKNPGTPMFKFDMVIMAGEQKGRHIFKNVVVSDADSAGGA